MIFHLFSKGKDIKTETADNKNDTKNTTGHIQLSKGEYNLFVFFLPVFVSMLLAVVQPSLLFS